MKKSKQQQNAGDGPKEDDPALKPDPPGYNRFIDTNLDYMTITPAPEKNERTGCWAFRVDRRFLAELDGELQEGWLRQGWGWDPKQDLRAMTVDAGAGRNRPMFNRVKKGDYILIAHLPQYGQITIAEATEDWDKGYNFSLWAKTNDHGHIFPAKPLLNFRRGSKGIPASIPDTFRNPSRFWNVSHLRKDIKTVLNLPGQDLESKSSVVERWDQRITDIFTQSELQKRLFSAAEKYFSKSDWEYLLVEIIQRLNPGWKVRRTGGKGEVIHGTDVLATIPDIFGNGEVGIAIQVKDYEGFINDDPINQILKAKNSNFWKDQNIQILELVVVVVRGDKQAGHQLAISAAEAGVRLIWSTEVEDLLFRSASRFMSDPERQTASLEPSAEDSEAVLEQQNVTI
jgi:hypothetical protein